MFALNVHLKFTKKKPSMLILFLLTGQIPFFFSFYKISRCLMVYSLIAVNFMQTHHVFFLSTANYF